MILNIVRALPLSIILLFCFKMLLIVISPSFLSLYEIIMILGINLITIGIITKSITIPFNVLCALLIYLIIMRIIYYIVTYIKLKKCQSNITFKDLLLNVNTNELLDSLYKKWKKEVKEIIEFNEFANIDSNNNIELNDELINKTYDIIEKKTQQYIDTNRVYMQSKLSEYINSIKTLAKKTNVYNTQEYVFSCECDNLSYLTFIDIKKSCYNNHHDKPTLLCLNTTIDKTLLNNDKYSNIDIVTEIIYKITDHLENLLITK